MNQQRSSFTGKLGFVLTTAGSAVGLGNIWRFPYLAAKYGGGIFLLVYLILAVTFGFSLMAAEIAIGRKTGLSPVGAFRKLDKRFTWVGYLGVIVPMIITPYYSVIGGWVTKYFAMFAIGQAEMAAGDGYFDGYIAHTAEPLLWFFLFMGLTALIVFFGVDKGIEKVSKVMMPMLVIMTIFIAIYTMCMPGAMEGVLYYITPDFGKFSVQTVLAAMGQLFYSMSIAMGILITYGSYMKKDVSIETSVHQVEIFDTGVAFLAGLMIIPSVFVYSGGDPAALGKGPGLMFVTLPKVFAGMPGGDFVGAAFFLMVFFAALTSSISLMETIVSFLQDRFRWGRRVACVVVFLFCLGIGSLSSLGFGVLDFVRLGDYGILDMFDFAANSVIMPIGALVTCIFVGYFLKPKALVEEIELTGRFKAKGLFTVIVKYVAPVCILLILVSSLLDAFGIVKI